MIVGVARSNFSATRPTPMRLTSSALYVVASFWFHCRCFTIRTFSNWVSCKPQFNRNSIFFTTFSLMPDSTTLKAHFLTTLAHGFIFEDARFFHNFAAVGLRTPLQVSVFSYFHVFLNCIELFGDVFRTEPLNLFHFKDFLALILHTRQSHCLPWFNLCLQMVSVTVYAESVTTCQCKKILLFVVVITTLAHFTSIINRLYFHIKKILIEIGN